MRKAVFWTLKTSEEFSGRSSKTLALWLGTRSTAAQSTRLYPRSSTSAIQDWPLSTAQLQIWLRDNSIKMTINRLPSQEFKITCNLFVKWTRPCWKQLTMSQILRFNNLSKPKTRQSNLSKYRSDLWSRVAWTSFRGSVLLRWKISKIRHNLNSIFNPSALCKTKPRHPPAKGKLNSLCSDSKRTHCKAHE